MEECSWKERMKEKGKVRQRRNEEGIRNEELEDGKRKKG